MNIDRITRIIHINYVQPFPTTTIVQETKMPNKDRLRLWAEALESGRFVQGRGALENIYKNGDRKNCCLGVACRVAMENGLEINAEDDYDNGKVYFDGVGDLLPLKVAQWFGITGNNPLLLAAKPYETSQRAISLNDAIQADFRSIAARVRVTYELNVPGGEKE